MALSPQEKNDYLHNDVIKNFKFWQSQSAGALLYNQDNTIVASNEAAQQDFGIANLVGFNDSTLFQKTNEDILKNINDYNYALELDYICKKMNRVREIAVTKGIRLNHVCIMPHNNEFRSLLIQTTPVSHENGEIIGAWTTASEFNFFGLTDHLNTFQNKSSTPITIARKKHKFPISLTSRQHEILFLLLAGMSQQQAANILNISRGNLAKTTTELICPKFGINDGNSGTLFQQAKTMDYHKYIPQSLCKMDIRILDHEINDKYLASNIHPGQNSVQ